MGFCWIIDHLILKIVQVIYQKKFFDCGSAKLIIMEFNGKAIYDLWAIIKSRSAEV